MNPQPIPKSEWEPICFAFGDVVRFQREGCRWSPNQLGIFTNLSEQMIRFVEARDRVPTIDTGARISRAFGIPLSRLIAEAERRLG